jgi:lipopolysaccharide/colanic/teichoic acid biosynthesis glycosyltransferase/glycosyltransferase involved in cell wall biosynthesis
MKLLVATDHPFLSYKSGVFDTYGLDRPFFDDYRKVFDQVEVLCRLAHVTTLPDDACRSDGDGVRFMGVPDAHGLAWLLRARLCGPAVAAAVERADAVVARVPSQLGWLAARQARRAGKPTMVEVLSDPRPAIAGISRLPHYRLLAWLEARRLRDLARNAAAGSYVSDRHLQRAYPLAAGKPAAGISDVRLLPGEIAAARMALPLSGRFRLILVASLIPIKRHRDLMLACRRALDEGVDLELHFAGDGPCRRELEAAGTGLGLAERLVFHGHIADRARLAALLDTSDLFVMTSATEGLPRALVEAMARGLPAAGTRTGGVRELVRESELFPVGDVGALASLIASLACDPGRLAAMSRHSIATASQYTADILSPRRIRLYEVLRKKAASPRSAPQASNPYRTWGKRLFDLALTIPGLILWLPLLALLSLVVHFKLGSPILFRQQRPGLGGQPFTLYKFRTMADTRDARGNLLPDRQRLTGLGRFLRQMSLDELPELINVLKGEMSLVGPRPLLMHYLERYTPEQARRHEVKPGITGWAQVNGRNALTWEEKFRLDVWYVDHSSLWLDLGILLTTLWKVSKREGISQAGQATMEEFKGSPVHPA